MRLLAWILTLCLVSHPSGADADSEAEPPDAASFLKCADVENDIARLQCFDEVVAQMEPGEVAEDVATAEPEPEPAPFKPATAKQVIEADEKMVETCKFLGSVRGTSGWGGAAAGAARKGSRNSAKKKAFKLGATHIVFLDFENSRGLASSSTEARAYRCETEDG